MEINQNGSGKKAMLHDSGDANGEKYDKSALTNLIVNYLPQTMSQDDIRSLFASVGDIDSCKLIRDKMTGQSLGYGFVNYKAADHARRAIEALNGLRLQNKTIKVSLARPSCELIKGANLYVSGLPKSMTQRELESMFAPSGNIITSRILCDSQTGLSKGVGFVRFDLRTEAERAIKMLNSTVPPGSTTGEAITVKFANHPSSGGYGPSGSHGGGIPTFPSAMASYVPQSSRQLMPPLHVATGRMRYSPLEPTAPGLPNGLSCGGTSASGGATGWCLFIYNLPPDTDDKILWQLFGPFGAVRSVKVMRDFTSQKCKGFGFVTMGNYEEAMVAITYLNGYQLANRILQVSFKKMRGGLGSGPTSL